MPELNAQDPSLARESEWRRDFQIPFWREGGLAPTTAAISPITPVTTPPTPGTAVNVDDRSIAERMNVMLSAAWLLLGLYVVIASCVLMAATTVTRSDAAPTPPLKALAVVDSWRWRPVGYHQ